MPLLNREWVKTSQESLTRTITRQKPAAPLRQNPASFVAKAKMTATNVTDASGGRSKATPCRRSEARWATSTPKTRTCHPRRLNEELFLSLTAGAMPKGSGRSGRRSSTVVKTGRGLWPTSRRTNSSSTHRPRPEAASLWTKSPEMPTQF